MDNLTKIPANRSVIPESCISFSEMSDYLAEFDLISFNETIKSIGENELAVFESTGSNIVYVDEASSKLKKALIDCIEKVWSVDKNFYEKVLSKFSSDTDAAKKALKINDKAINNIPDGKQFGIVHKFDMLDKVDFSSNASKFSKEVEKVFKVMSAESNQAHINKSKSLLENEIYSAISGLEVDSMKSMKSELKKKMVGDTVRVDKTWIKNNSSELKSVILSGSSVVAIKDAYNKEKKIYNTIISIIDDLDDDVSNVVVAWESVLHNMLRVMHACYAVQMDVYKKRFAEYRLIVTKINRLSIAESTDTTNLDPPDTSSDNNSDRFDKTEEELEKNNNNSSNNNYNTESIVFDDFERSEN